MSSANLINAVKIKTRVVFIIPMGIKVLLLIEHPVITPPMYPILSLREKLEMRLVNLASLAIKLKMENVLLIITSHIRKIHKDGQLPYLITGRIKPANMVRNVPEKIVNLLMKNKKMSITLFLSLDPLLIKTILKYILFKEGTCNQ
jgi:hypothetical protein